MNEPTKLGPEFWEAQGIAKRAGMFIQCPRNTKGQIINYNLFRATTPKPTFIGQRVNEKDLLALVKSAARVAVPA